MHLKIIAAILGLALAGFFALTSLWIYKRHIKAEQLVLEEMENLEKVHPEEPPDPGLASYQRAMESIRKGRHLEARDILLDLVRLYQDSIRYPEAKRVIGEINMDLLLSKAPIPGKKEHIVQRGESLALIAGKERTTYDYILRVNHLVDDVIHPGDRLTVFPLDLSVVIKTAEKTLTLMRKGRFFKEYQVEMVAFPPDVRGPFRTEVTGKAAYLEGARIAVTDPGYAEAERRIVLAQSGFYLLPSGVAGQPPAIRPGDPAEEFDKDLLYGVFLRPEDMFEIYSLLTMATEVNVAD